MKELKNLDEILQCPVTGEELNYVEHLADSELAGNIKVHTEAGSGFINKSKTVFYPVKNDIVCMLPEYAFTSIEQHTNKDTLSVQKFYNEFGWKKNQENKYHDNKLFIDQQTVADEYRTLTTERVSSFLQAGGTYMLDIASGPVYQKESIEFSKNFACRICIDISIRALEEAQQNLQGKNAIFILGDICNIPLKNESCDRVISMHTLYHVPQEKQSKGMKELIRVCKAGSNVIIAYNWGWHSMLMNLALLPSRAVRFISRLRKIYFANKNSNSDSTDRLYFYSHSPGYFRKHLPENCSIRFTVLKSLHENFITLYLGNNKTSKKFLGYLYRLENKYPSFFGTHGAFALIVIKKLLPAKTNLRS